MQIGNKTWSSNLVFIRKHLHWVYHDKPYLLIWIKAFINFKNRIDMYLVSTHRTVYVKIQDTWKQSFNLMSWHNVMHLLRHSFFPFYLTCFVQMSTTSKQIICWPLRQALNTVLFLSFPVMLLKVFCLSKNILVFAYSFKSIHFHTTKTLISLTICHALPFNSTFWILEIL